MRKSSSLLFYNRHHHLIPHWKQHATNVHRRRRRLIRDLQEIEPRENERTSSSFLAIFLRWRVAVDSVILPLSSGWMQRRRKRRRRRRRKTRRGLAGPAAELATVGNNFWLRRLRRVGRVSRTRERGRKKRLDIKKYLLKGAQGGRRKLDQRGLLFLPSSADGLQDEIFMGQGEFFAATTSAVRICHHITRRNS